MAGVIQTASSTTPGNAANWEAELNLTELSRRGYDGISLTEWAAGDTDKPQIAAGGVIEINGALAKYAAQTALTDEVGLADGWCYIKHVVSGTDVVPTLTNTFGTWDTAKQGFYDGTDRYSLFVMYRSGAITKIFTQKHIYPYSQSLDAFQGEYAFTGRTILSNMGNRTGSRTSFTGTYVVPAGMHYIAVDVSTIGTNAGSIDIQDSGGTWRSIIIVTGSSALQSGTLVISDGTNVRMVNSAGTVYRTIVSF